MGAFPFLASLVSLLVCLPFYLLIYIEWSFDIYIYDMYIYLGRSESPRDIKLVPFRLIAPEILGITNVIKMKGNQVLFQCNQHHSALRYLFLDVGANLTTTAAATIGTTTARTTPSTTSGKHSNICHSTTSTKWSIIWGQQCLFPFPEWNYMNYH